MLHVSPIDDLEEHELHGTQCKCNPKVDFSGEEILVIHNSFDMREIIEQANEILKE